MKKTPKKDKSGAGTKGVTHPIDHKEEVQQSNDEHIDQDYPGFPHHPAKTIHNGSAGAFDATESIHDDED
jgi:hypothetical protein